MISKELLTEVLNLNITTIESGDYGDEIYYHYTNEEVIFGKMNLSNGINIYALAHKCKEWIENNTHWDLMIIGYEVYLMEDIWGEGGAVTHKRFTKQREWYMNLFKAAEYILEQKVN